MTRIIIMTLLSFVSFTKEILETKQVYEIITFPSSHSHHQQNILASSPVMLAKDRYSTERRYVQPITEYYLSRLLSK